MDLLEKQLFDAHKAIGIIDSGVGGLTVMHEISSRLPYESIVYFGDTARMPYGPRSYEEVRRFVFDIIDFLNHQEIKMLVVACNTATVAGLPYYQEACKIPVLGVVEPGVKAALSKSKNGIIGVIGTEGTISSMEYEKALSGNKNGIKVFSKSCPLFVLLVENDLVNTNEAEKVAREYLAPIISQSIDTLILGCTHYPLMSGLIGKIVGPEISIVNSAKEIAAEVEAVLLKGEMSIPVLEKRPSYRFFVSGSTESFEGVGEKLFKKKIKAYQVKL